MILKDLKQNMLLPKKEIFINKTVNIRGIDVYLNSITLELHGSILWVMYALPCNFYEEIDSEERTEYTSNRDEMINSITKNNRDTHIYISEITIQKQKMKFSLSNTRHMSHMNCEKYMHLQHFIENGMDTTNWNEVDLDNIVIATYEQKENEEFPEIDCSKKLDITLKVSEAFKQVLIDQPICFKFNKIKKDKKFFFYDYIEKKNRTFYIDKIEYYDIWEDAKHKFENELMQNFPKEQVKQAKEQYLDCLEDICPKGMNLAVVEYETEDDIQLNFYSKEYLDKRPVRKNSSSSIIFFNSDKEPGSNGFRKRTCILKPVEKDFNGSIEIELLSWYMKVPEEIIRI